MRIITLTILTICFLNGKGISTVKYGKFIYTNNFNNDISCIVCHGKRGKGRAITVYKFNGAVKIVKVKDISNISLYRFELALSSSNHISFMPKYYFSIKEMESIYKYIESVR